MLRYAVLFCCLLLPMGSSLEAQVLYGSIVGNVTDPSGAPVPGAAVTIINRETGQSRQTVANDAGSYSFPTVASGAYDLKILKEGFTSVTRGDVVVTINNITRVDIALQLGAVTESVVVQAQAAALQTDRAEVRSEVTSKTLENLPMPPGRNYQQI